MFVVHHFSSLGSLLYCIIRGRYSNAIIWGLVTGEVSNPFILIRKNLDVAEKYPTTSFVSGVIFSFVFLFSRFGRRNVRTYVCLIYLWNLFIGPSSLFLKVCGGILWHLSLNWCFQIVNLLFKAVSERYPAKCVLGTYACLKTLRNSIVFKIFLQLIFIFICYFWTFYSWNHEYII